MLKDHYKKAIRENHVTLLHYGHRLLNPNEPLTDKLPLQREHGCQLPLANGDVVTLTLTPLTATEVVCSFTTDGIEFETFDAPKNKGSYFNQFKKKIEKMYETSLLDVDKCRECFNNYLDQVIYSA